MILRSAIAAEASALSELAIRSKGHWGYDQAFLDACRDELTIEEQEVEAGRFVVADNEGIPVGFYSLDGQPPDGHLAHLFVEPAWIGRGVGGQLWRHMQSAAETIGFQRITIEADPGAVPFYQAMGARQVGTVPSGSIPGRMLPRLVYQVSTRPG